MVWFCEFIVESFILFLLRNNKKNLNQIPLLILYFRPNNVYSLTNFKE